MPNRPMLDDIELQLVQKMETNEDEVLTQHGVPALEGDFLQRQKRRATQITLNGILTGPGVGDGLKTLRDKFRGAEPVPFVMDITTATRVSEVPIQMEDSSFVEEICLNLLTNSLSAVRPERHQC